jgi:hypothetical protein
MLLTTGKEKYSSNLNKLLISRYWRLITSLLHLKNMEQRKRNIHFSCGYLNQSAQMHAITRNMMKEHSRYFIPCYGDGIIKLTARMGWLNFTVLRGRHRCETEEYLSRHNL